MPVTISTDTERPHVDDALEEFLENAFHLWSPLQKAKTRVTAHMSPTLKWIEHEDAYADCDNIAIPANFDPSVARETEPTITPLFPMIMTRVRKKEAEGVVLPGAGTSPDVRMYLEPQSFEERALFRGKALWSSQAAVVLARHELETNAGGEGATGSTPVAGQHVN